MNRHIKTDKLPKPVGPYSQLIEFGGFLFLSGQIALDPLTGDVVQGDAAVQTDLILKSVKNALLEQRLSTGHIIKVTAYLVDSKDFNAFNTVYAHYFNDNPPVRTTVFVQALPKNAKVELDIIASTNPVRK
jgi:2-iminobutanoate/2-iminopropanoate deaminase